VEDTEGEDFRRRKEELDGYRAKGNMKRKPIYFPASLLSLFVTSAMLYLIEIVFFTLGICLLMHVLLIHSSHSTFSTHPEILDTLIQQPTRWKWPG
jgi:hypothetical protein